MALVVNDRVKETSTTTGTGTFSLAGAVTGFETFVAGIGNSNTTYYAIVNTNNGEFEVGLGTVTDATPDTLARTTIISSSNSDSAVDFAAGTKNVFCTLPASKSVILDASGNIVANNGSNLTDLNADNLASGTVPDARFPATLPALNGSALTALNATQLTSGTVPDARFPSTLPAANGSNLTNLNATALASGTVANARLDADLAAIAGLTSAADKGIQFTGSGTAATYDLTAAGKALLDDANAATQRTTLGLVIGTDVQAFDAQLADIAGLSPTSGKIIQGDGSNFGLSAYTLPTSDGSANQVLTTDGSGAVTFATPTVGDITGVTAGSGLTGGGTSGDVTLNVGAGTGVTVNANDIAIGQSVATSASPTFAGLTTTADINFGDNDKALFGDGSDFEIYHDGSNAQIKNSTGQVFFLSDTATKFKDAGGNETFAAFNDNGAVDLYYDNSKKFETTSGGATVTGTMTATTFSGSGASLTSIPNGALDNSAITINGTSTSLGGSINVGDITGVTAGTLLDGGGTSGSVTLNVDLSELSTSTSNGDGDFFCVVDSANAQKKLTKGNINISGFNNDSGFSTTTGTVTSVQVTPGTGLDGGGTITTSGNLDVTLDLSELTDMTATMTGSDEFIVLDSGAERRKAASEIGLSIFNNDAGFTTNTGDITSVVAGDGLTGGATSGAATLNVGAGTGIDVAADAISVDVSDFMSNGSNNRVVTATGTDGMNAEANMTFDGTDLSIPQNIVHLGDTNCYIGFHATDQWRVVTGGTERFEVNSSSITAARNFVPGANDTYDLGASGNVWRNIYTGDLHLSNEAKDEGNAVDGTKGNWTIQEGEEHLYILNNKNGKKYKFKLEEM